MSIKTRIFGGKFGTSPDVTKRGQLVVGNADTDTFYLGTAIANNTAVNVLEPKRDSKFIITTMILSADRSVGANGAVIDVFENNIGPTDGTIVKQIIQEEVAKQTRMVLTGLNIEVNEGVWINVKADDVIVRCNLAGYYIGIS